MKRFILGCMVSLVTMSVWATDIEALRKKAESGDAIAQNNLGLAYECGDDVPQNYEEAIKWYRKSAEQDCVYAQINLGLAYLHGTGVEKNLEKAFEWTQKAAQQNHPTAWYNLGEMYEQGWGVKQDFWEARNYYRSAALQKHPAALIRWGLMLENGVGGGIDSQRAAFCYEYVAKQGYNIGSFLLMTIRSDACKKEIEVKALAEIPEASRRDAVMQFEQGLRYADAGEPEKAEEWIRKSAEQGFVMGMMMCAIDATDRQEMPEAFQYHKRAADLQLIKAEMIVADTYYAEGKIEEALPYFNRLAELGHPRAQYAMWVMAEGEAETFKWLRKMAEQDYEYKPGQYAAHELGVSFLALNHDCEQNIEEAMRWFVRAAENGCPQSKKRLEALKMFSEIALKELDAEKEVTK